MNTYKPWLKNYPSGVPHEIDLNRYNSINDIFSESIQLFTNRTAFKNFGCGLSFKKIDDLSSNFASYLQNELNLKKGDRIAIQLPNVMQFPIALFGAFKAGLVVVNTNPLYTETEMRHQFQNSEVKAIVILAQFAHLLEKVQPETQIKHVVITEVGDQLNFIKGTLINFVLKKIKKAIPHYSLHHDSWKTALKKGSARKFSAVPIFPDDTAFLQYTGGTTGRSKGAVLTHRNIITNMLQIKEWMKPRLIEGQETAITPLPLYHIFSLTVCCLAFMSTGVTNVLITNPRDIPDFIKTLRKEKFSIMSGVNTLYNALALSPLIKKVDFSHFKIGVAGAMALQNAVKENWFKTTGTNIIEGYGLTEASPVVCCNPVDGTDVAGTIGLPLPSTEIKIIDENGQDVTEQGLPGELCVKGPQVMQGYFNTPEETAKVLKDGWLLTGDIALVEKTGFVRIVDRKKDMILVSGFNVYPNEVEDILVKHPGVIEAAAIGIPDAHSGEVVKVFIVKKDPALTADDVIQHAKKFLTNYKVPKKVEFVTELPKTNVGKVLRRALRDRN